MNAFSQPILRCCILVAALHGATSTHASWTQHGGNAGHSYFVDAALDPSLFRPAWTIQHGHQTSLSWTEWDIVSDGERAYYTTLEGSNISGSFHVTAVDLHTGQQVWRTTLTSPSHRGVGAPSVSDGVVYVNRAGHSGGGNSADWPRLYRLDSSTGQHRFATTYESQWYSNDQPTIAPGHVIVGGGYYGGMYSFSPVAGRNWFRARENLFEPMASIGGDKVFAFDNRVYNLSDGTPIAQIAAPMDWHLTHTHLSWVSESNRVFLPIAQYAPSEVYGYATYDVDSLQHVRNYPTGSDYSYRMAVGGGKVAATTNDKLIMFDEPTGSILWEWNPSGQVGPEVVLTRSHAFVQVYPASFRDTTHVHAIDLATGQSVWSYAAVGKMSLSDGYLLLSTHQQVVAVRLVPEPANGTSAILAVIMILCASWRTGHPMCNGRSECESSDL